jgi:hypothetical protein
VPLVLYSALRVALLALALLGLWAVGLRDWLLVAVAAAVSAAGAYVLLTRQRDAAALWIARRAEQRRAAGVRVSSTVDADAAIEDAAADQIARPRPSSTP